MTGLTEAEVNAAVLADYKAFAGQVVFVTEIECYIPDSSSETAICTPPAIARVIAYDERHIQQDVLRWMDDIHCDPVYDLAILAPHPALQDLQPSWAYGTSRSTTGKTSPGAVTLADPETRRRYRNAPALRPPQCWLPAPKPVGLVSKMLARFRAAWNALGVRLFQG